MVGMVTTADKVELPPRNTKISSTTARKGKAIAIQLKFSRRSPGRCVSGSARGWSLEPPSVGCSCIGPPSLRVGGCLGTTYRYRVREQVGLATTSEAAGPAHTAAK